MSIRGDTTIPLASPQPRTARKPLRWWMVFLCLLACWLAWWGTTYWLSPKPAWSIKQDKHAYYPIQESADHRLLLCADITLDDNSEREGPFGLVILERDTGNLKHRMTLRGDDASVIDSISGGTATPKIVKGQHIRWFTHTSNENGTLSYKMNLNRWSPVNDSISTSKQVWNGYHLQLIEPEASNIVIFNYSVPLAIYQMGYLDSPICMAVLQTLNNANQLPQLTWYESWELPDDLSSEPRFLASWAAPYSRWGMSAPHISEDGQWAVFTEPSGNDCQAAQRAKATGKSSFSGNELFQMFRSPHQELLVYNTRSGKVQHRFSDHDAYHFVVQSMQNYLVMQAHYPDAKSKVSLEELLAAGKQRSDMLYRRLFLRADELFRIDEKGVTRIKRSSDVQQLSLGDRLYFSGNRLQAFSHENGTHAELEVVGDELKVRQLWPERDDKLKAINLLPFENQGFVHGGSQPMPASLKSWLANSPRLRHWAEKLWNVLHPRMGFTVVELTSSDMRCHSITDSRPNTVKNASMLYCFKIIEADKTATGATLNAYSLPVKLHSPWWSRVAGLLPLLLLVLYVLLSKRASATKTQE